MIWLLASLASAACTVVVGAKAHLPDGPRDNTNVVIVDDAIAAIGTAVPGLSLRRSEQDGTATYQDAPCTWVSGMKRELAPGFIEPSSTLGLVEVPAERASYDNIEGDSVRSAVVSVHAFNPRSTLLGLARSEGVTSSVIGHPDGLLGAAHGLVQLAAESQEEAIRIERVWYPVDLHTSRVDSLHRLSVLLADAREFAAGKTNRERPFFEDADAADLAALADVAKGKVPLLVSVKRASDVEAVLRWAKAEKVKVVLNNPLEGHLVAEKIAEAGVPVIIDPYQYGPAGFDAVAGTSSASRILVEAGVDVMFSTYDTLRTSTLRQRAANAIREGVPYAKGLAGITSVPAAVIGANTGSIEVGKTADLVLWTGDPLELSSQVEALFVGGEAISLTTRQTELRDRYMRLPGSPVPPLALPASK